MKSSLIGFAVFVLSASAMGLTSADSVIDLPADTILKFNVPFVVTSVLSRAGTPRQAFIMTIDVDLKGETPEAILSRSRNKAAVEKLRALKYFNSLERVFCFLDFHAKFDRDFDIEKGAIFKFITPIDYGTPSETFTKTGESIRLEAYADKSISGSFSEDSPLRRLYCSFNAEEKERYNENFLDDVKISHLEALLAPYLELKY